jgi:hypothetical protein
MHRAVPDEFDEACDAVATILDEIKRDDSYCRDSRFKEVVFTKYAELKTLYEYIVSANNNEYTKYMFSELKHQVINFLHYQKLHYVWSHEWKKAFDVSRAFHIYQRFIPLRNEFEKIRQTKTQYVAKETEDYTNGDHTQYRYDLIEDYIKKEDSRLELIKKWLASNSDDATRPQLRADFAEIEKALKCRQYDILLFRTQVPKFRDLLHDLWPLMHEHSLWALPTPARYRGGSKPLTARFGGNPYIVSQQPPESSWRRRRCSAHAQCGLD